MGDIATSIRRALDAYGGTTADGELRNRSAWREASAADLSDAITARLRIDLQGTQPPLFALGLDQDGEGNA